MESLRPCGLHSIIPMIIYQLSNPVFDFKKAKRELNKNLSVGIITKQATVFLQFKFTQSGVFYLPDPFPGKIQPGTDFFCAHGIIQTDAIQATNYLLLTGAEFFKQAPDLRPQ